MINEELRREALLALQVAYFEAREGLLHTHGDLNTAIERRFLDFVVRISLTHEPSGSERLFHLEAQKEG